MTPSLLWFCTLHCTERMYLENLSDLAGWWAGEPTPTPYGYTANALLIVRYYRGLS